METPAEVSAKACVKDSVKRFSEWLISLRRVFPKTRIQALMEHGTGRLLDELRQELHRASRPHTTLVWMVQPVLDAYALAGHIQADRGLSVSREVVRKANMQFSFDEVNPRSVEAAANFRNGLIREISEQLAQSIQLVVSNGIMRGQAPETIARDISAVIGMTQRQAQAYANKRTSLQTQGLPPSEVERRLVGYASEVISNRAITIARTETLRAANLGQEVAVRQANDGGAFGDLEVRRFWIDTNDERTRPDHKAVPKLNAEGVGLDQPFRYPGGRTIMRPGDPNASSADMVILCRCCVAHRLFKRRMA